MQNASATVRAFFACSGGNTSTPIPPSAGRISISVRIVALLTNHDLRVTTAIAGTIASAPSQAPRRFRTDSHSHKLAKIEEIPPLVTLFEPLAEAPSARELI